MKRILLLVGVLFSSALSFSQTGTVASFTKISETSGNLSQDLAAGGKFGFVLESSTAGTLLSGAPDDGNGAFYILELDDMGAVASSEKILANDFSYFEGITNARFGTAVVDLGDINDDGKNEFVVGAPGISPSGKLLSLISSEGSYDLAEIQLPTIMENEALEIGSFLFYENGVLLVTSSQGAGSIYECGLDIGEGLAVINHWNVTHPLLANKIESGDQFGASPTLTDIDGDGVKDLLCGAPGDDDQDINFGAVYVLYRNAEGDVSGIQKLSRLEGDFGGFLNVDDEFGASVRAIGDLDENGIIDLAVGAPGDDDGGTDIGAIWILFMHADGWVINERKINRFEGNFTLDLSAFDDLGRSLAAIGDHNGDGTIDIAVGAPMDDDGGTDKGAVYSIFIERCPAPSGNFDFEVNGGEVSFFAEGGPGYTYIWNFDDGGYSQQQNPIHTYESSGTYMVCLAINNECGGDNFCENVTVNVTLNTEDHTIADFKLYPNPATNFVRVEHQLPGASIQLTDITGKIVRQLVARTGTAEIDLANLPRGVYFLELRKEDIWEVRKLLVVG